MVADACLEEFHAIDFPYVTVHDPKDATTSFQVSTYAICEGLYIYVCEGCVLKRLACCSFNLLVWVCLDTEWFIVKS